MTAQRSSQPHPELPAGLRPPLENVPYSKLVEEWLANDDGEIEETWTYLRHTLQETRRDLGMQPLLQRRSSPATSV